MYDQFSLNTMDFPETGCQAPYVGLSVADLCYGSQYMLFMGLMDLMIRHACKISDPCGRITPKTTPDDSYDFIIIGSGSAGSTVAGRLAEVSQWKTLLLEAGMDEPPATQVPLVPAFDHTPIDWNFTTQQEGSACLNSGGYCYWPRGKVLGGTSNFNGMMYMRGTPKDYQKWVRFEESNRIIGEPSAILTSDQTTQEKIRSSVDAGNTEWSFDKLLPYFKVSEDNRQVGSLVDSEYHGTGGPWTIQHFNDYPPLVDDILLAAKQAGFPVRDELNGGEHVGFTRAQANNRDGVRLSLAKAFVRPHKDDPHFHIMLNSTVTKILINGEGKDKKATGVQFLYNGVTYTVYARKEVILAAGAVQSPQLLLLSGIGPKDELDAVGIEQIHDLPGVGKGIKNHVSYYVNATINEPNNVDINAEVLSEYIQTRKGPLSSTGLSQVTAILPSSYVDPDDPDIQFFLHGYDNTCAYSGIPDSPVDPQNPTNKRSISIASANLKPKSKGYIGLLSNNPLDPPKIVANYFTDPSDIKVIIDGIRIIQNFTRSPALKEKHNFTLTKDYTGNCTLKYEYDSDDYWECVIRYNTYPENHQCCSCKMAPEDNEEACVNQYLQVHGISNLRVVDAAAAYDLPSANLQATVVAIAERASDFIKQKYLT